MQASVVNSETLDIQSLVENKAKTKNEKSSHEHLSSRSSNRQKSPHKTQKSRQRPRSNSNASSQASSKSSKSQRNFSKNRTQRQKTGNSVTSQTNQITQFGQLNSLKQRRGTPKKRKTTSQNVTNEQQNSKTSKKSAQHPVSQTRYTATQVAQANIKMLGQLLNQNTGTSRSSGRSRGQTLPNISINNSSANNSPPISILNKQSSMKKGKSDPVKLRHSQVNKSNKSSLIVNKISLGLESKQEPLQRLNTQNVKKDQIKQFQKQITNPMFKQALKDICVVNKVRYNKNLLSLRKNEQPRVSQVQRNKEKDSISSINTSFYSQDENQETETLENPKKYPRAKSSTPALTRGEQKQRNQETPIKMKQFKYEKSQTQIMTRKKVEKALPYVSKKTQNQSEISQTEAKQQLHSFLRMYTLQASESKLSRATSTLAKSLLKIKEDSKLGNKDVQISEIHPQQNEETFSQKVIQERDHQWNVEDESANLDNINQNQPLIGQFSEFNASQKQKESFDSVSSDSQQLSSSNTEKKRLNCCRKVQAKEDPENPLDQQIQQEIAGKCLIFPDSKCKNAWDLITSIFLVVTCFMTPYSLAFEEMGTKHLDAHECNSYWSCIELSVDIVFIIEIFVSFNVTYLDKEINEYVTDRTVIAKSYLKSWFTIDFVAILPRFIEQLAKGDYGTISQILSFLKIARITRLIKLFRLARMAKISKEKQKLRKQIQQKSDMNVGIERLIIFAVFSILFVHTLACVWIFLAVLIDETQSADDVEGSSKSSWVSYFDLNFENHFDLYVVANYFTLTTITTVGYGDFFPTNVPERILAMVTMVIGVVAFSIATGSFSSIISQADSKQEAYRARLDILRSLRREYRIDNKLYQELHAFINFRSSINNEERENFLNELPTRLRFQLSSLLYEKYRLKIDFFKQVDENQSFIGWLCPKLRPLEVISGALIQVEQEKHSHISFIMQGSASYIMQRYGKTPYYNIGQGAHFGFVDVIFRARQYALKDFDSDSESEKDFEDLLKMLKSKFTVIMQQDCYLLQMETYNLANMSTEFPDVYKMFREQEDEHLREILQLKATYIFQYENKIKLEEEENSQQQLSSEENEIYQELSAQEEPQSIRSTHRIIEEEISELKSSCSQSQSVSGSKSSHKSQTNEIQSQAKKLIQEMPQCIDNKIADSHLQHSSEKKETISKSEISFNTSISPTKIQIKQSPPMIVEEEQSDSQKLSPLNFQDPKDALNQTMPKNISKDQANAFQLPPRLRQKTTQSSIPGKVQIRQLGSMSTVNTPILIPQKQADNKNQNFAEQTVEQREINQQLSDSSDSSLSYQQKSSSKNSNQSTKEVKLELKKRANSERRVKKANDQQVKNNLEQDQKLLPSKTPKAKNTSSPIGNMQQFLSIQNNELEWQEQDIRRSVSPNINPNQNIDDFLLDSPDIKQKIAKQSTFKSHKSSQHLANVLNIRAKAEGHTQKLKRLDSDERLVITALQDEENMPFKSEYKKDLKRLLNTKVKRVSVKNVTINSQQAQHEQTGSSKREKLLSEKDQKSLRGSVTDLHSQKSFQKVKDLNLTDNGKSQKNDNLMESLIQKVLEKVNKTQIEEKPVLKDQTQEMEHLISANSEMLGLLSKQVTSLMSEIRQMKNEQHKLVKETSDVHKSQENLKLERISVNELSLTDKENNI